MGIETNDLRFDDTQVMAYLLQQEPLGLKPLCVRHAGMRMQSYDDVLMAVRALDSDVAALGDEPLDRRAHALRDRGRNDGVSHDLRVELFAVIRELSTRVLGLRPYDEQIVAAAALVGVGFLLASRDEPEAAATATIPVVAATEPETDDRPPVVVARFDGECTACDGASCTRPEMPSPSASVGSSRLSRVVSSTASALSMKSPKQIDGLYVQLSLMLHGLMFVGSIMFVVVHVYVATIGNPGTLEAMLWGRVSRTWAKHHHPKWYKEVTGDNQ